MSARDSAESSHHSEVASDGRPSLDAPSGNASAGARFPSSSPSSTRRSGEYESGSQRSRKRGGGGFLLADNFGAGRDGDSAGHRPHSAYEGKGKSRIDGGSLNVLKRRSANVPGGLNGSIRSSPLAKVMVAQGDGQDSRSSTEVDSANFATDHGTNGVKPSRDTGEFLPGPSEDLSVPQAPAPTAGGIDPTQIVNMALSLSESRRRNFTAGQLPPQTATGRRVTSAGSAVAVPHLQGGYQAYGPGSSLRQYLNQQRRISRTVSPGTSGRKASAVPRHTSLSYAATPQMDTLSPPEQTIAPSYSFSAATLARAEKAKRYIELSFAHRHLLEVLPPLKPDSTAPGNSIYSASSVPGTPNFELHKTPSYANEKHPLGRQYNPLQLIRNRKLRARTRMSLNPDTQEFENLLQVSQWVTAVEEGASDPMFRVEDRVILPVYPLGSDPAARESYDTSENGHRRNESTGGARKRPRTDWQFSPAELLAEAYWLERNDNKQLIENRHGNKIFPPKQRPDHLLTRPSYESQRSANSAPFDAGSHEGDEVDRDSQRHVERGRKRHLAHVDSGNKLKHVLNKARGRSRSSNSDLSTSDHEAGGQAKRPRLPLLTSFGEENVGPLERQMDKIMDAEMEDSAKAEQALISPGTPNKWGTDPRFSRPSQSPPSGSTKEERFILAETDVTDWGQQQLLSPERPLMQRDTKLGHPDEPRSSMEEADSTNPNSPVVGFFPGLGSDLTPPLPRSKRQSPVRKSKKHILTFIKSDGNKDGRKHAFADDFDVDGGSRQPSAEEQPPRSSFESMASPERGKKLFSHKTNESLSSFNARPSSRGKDTKEPKEPESVMRRFFKGGRLGEIVRTEGARLGDAIRKRDSPQSAVEEDFDISDGMLEESDTDEDLEFVSTKPRQTLKRTTTDTTNGLLSPTRIDQKGRYHIENLPTFKSSTAKPPSEPSRPTTPNHDHISTQQHLLRQINRSPRLDRLAPPTLDISRVSTRTSATSPSANMNRTTTADTTDSQRSSYGFPHLFSARSRSRAGKRLAAILDVPGQVGRGGMPHTALATLRPERSTSRPKLTDKRHWSISDAPDRRSSQLRLQKASGVRAADVERVKALLWCSGVKAAELVQRAARPRAEGPSEWLVGAAQAAGAQLQRLCVPAKEEFVLAGRLLNEAMERDVNALHDSAAAFRESSVGQLGLRIADLKGVVESCSERARGMGDAATGFGAEVTGQRAIEVRMVMDSLDKLARARRRRLRWLRRIGFGLLEWVVLLFMWWVWFVVVVVRTVWRVVKGTGRAVRWILWLD